MNTMKNLSVLLVEDNRVIASQLLDYLTEQNFICDYADSGKLALSLLGLNDYKPQQTEYDVVILDLMLPDIDGLELCDIIKTQLPSNVPVLMLTARDSLEDKGLGFEAGTDDYLCKPFEFAEVAMRCIALARRQQLHQSSDIQVGDLSLDTRKHNATRAGQTLTLSATDYRILEVLIKAYPEAVTRNQLVARVWGDDVPDSDALRTHIYTLRKALDRPFEHAMLKTIHGVGFKLVAEQPEAS